MSERRLRVLATLPDVAHPVDGGKRLRCDAVLRGLASVADVDVAFLHSRAPDDFSPVPPDVQVRRWLRCAPDPLPRRQAALAAARHALPVHLAAQRWDVVRAHLRDWIRDDYDLVWFGGLDHAHMLHHDLTAATTVVDCDDVETQKWRAFLAGPAARSVGAVERLQRRIEIPLWQRVQRGVDRWADTVVVCSDLDADRFAGPRSPGTRTAVVANTYPDPGGVLTRTPPRHPVAVMVANYTTPQNLDAAVAAADGLLPSLRALHPDARVRLVGRGADELTHLADRPGLDLVGPVDAVTDELRCATAVVVPMRFGGGTRLKVLEAFAHGVPVVSTAMGCEGVDGVDGEHLLVRDDAAGMADAVLAVHRDPGLAARLATGGRARYVEAFRPAASFVAVAAAVTGAITGGGPPSHRAGDR